MASIQDRLDRKTISWRPEEGDSLTGRVVDIDTHEHPEYGVSPIITLLTDAGEEYTWHVFGRVAQGEVAKHRPKVGDLMGVKYLGTPAGKTYKLWKVVVEHVDPEPARELDWSTFEAPPEEYLVDEEPGYVDDRPAPNPDGSESF